MTWHVKGILFKDYVRMIKRYPEIDWGKYLRPEDREILDGLILPSQWYPLETYQRCGSAVYREIARGDPEMARSWGRAGMDDLVELYHNNLVEEGDPLETLDKFKGINSRLFDFEGFDLTVSGKDQVYIVVDPEFGELEMEAYSCQMMGSFERLIQLSGAVNIKAEFRNKAWEGEGKTVIEISWEAPKPGTAAGKGPKKIMVIDDDENSCRLAEITLRRAGYDVTVRTHALGSSAEIKSFKPDLILLDLMMPGLSGEALADVIAAGIKTRPRILFYSNKSPQELKKLVKKKGVEGFVCKIYGPSALLIRVLHFFTRGRGRLLLTC
jgi:CheY-like chemotaxis protein